MNTKVTINRIVGVFILSAFLLFGKNSYSQDPLSGTYSVGAAGDAGYETGMFGKWHLGDSEGRYPTDQGFDEWYGIPNSSDESYWPDNDLFRKGVTPQVKYEFVMESTKGKKPKQVKVYDSVQRLMMDREITDKAKEFIKRKANGDQTIFLFYSLHPNAPTC